MSDAMALRLDDETRTRIARLAARRGTSRSAVVREAITALIEREDRQAALRPHDLAGNLLGSVHGGDPDRSTEVGRKMRRMLKARRAHR